MHGKLRILQITLLLVLFSNSAWAELPTGYFVWTKGDHGSRASRKIYRMTLPEKTDIRALTSGEDVEGQISPGGKWVAYAKAKLANSTYLAFNAWKLYVVSIHGVGEGREEIKIDDNGYWPSWADDNTLYFSQRDEAEPLHTKIIKATLDDWGNVLDKTVAFSTHAHFAAIAEVNECYMARDGSWIAARTRGSAAVAGVGALTVNPPDFTILAQAGSKGCMPQVAPSGTWAIIAGRGFGILWGDAPSVPNGKRNELLIPAHSADDLCYHPGISSDEQWVMAAHSTEDDHNAGAYNIYLYKLNGRTATDEQVLADGGFNGWPALWVGEPSEPPPPRPRVNDFHPSSYTILTGENVTLYWTTSFANEVTIDGSTVAADGEQTEALQASKTFTLIASSTITDGSDTKTVDITVNSSPQAVVIDSFAIEPSTVVLGNSAVLSWRATNPTTLDVDGVAVPPTGMMEVSPEGTTDYVLTANGHQGPVTQKVTLTISPLNPLLPDRGGCLCGASGELPWSAGLLALAGFALWIVLRSRRRNHS